MKAAIPVLILAALTAMPAQSEVPAGECDSAARVVTAAGGMVLVAGAKAKDAETKGKAGALIADMELVLGRVCELTPEESHEAVHTILKGMASSIPAPTRSP